MGLMNELLNTDTKKDGPKKVVKQDKKVDKKKSQLKKLINALNFMAKKSKGFAITAAKRVNIKVTTNPNICYKGCKNHPAKFNLKSTKKVAKLTNKPVVNLKKI